jgi:hypothetical protein
MNVLFSRVVFMFNNEIFSHCLSMYVSSLSLSPSLSLYIYKARSICLSFWLSKILVGLRLNLSTVLQISSSDTTFSTVLLILQVPDVCFSIFRSMEIDSLLKKMRAQFSTLGRYLFVAILELPCVWISYCVREDIPEKCLLRSSEVWRLITLQTEINYISSAFLHFCHKVFIRLYLEEEISLTGCIIYIVCSSEVIIL